MLKSDQEASNFTPEKEEPLQPKKATLENKNYTKYVYVIGSAIIVLIGATGMTLMGLNSEYSNNQHTSDDIVDIDEEDTPEANYIDIEKIRFQDNYILNIICEQKINNGSELTQHILKRLDEDMVEWKTEHEDSEQGIDIPSHFFQNMYYNAIVKINGVIDANMLPPNYGEKSPIYNFHLETLRTDFGLLGGKKINLKYTITNRSSSAICNLEDLDSQTLENPNFKLKMILDNPLEYLATIKKYLKSQELLNHVEQAIKQKFSFSTNILWQNSYKLEMDNTSNILQNLKDQQLKINIIPVMATTNEKTVSFSGKKIFTLQIEPEFKTLTRDEAFMNELQNKFNLQNPINLFYASLIPEKTEVDEIIKNNIQIQEKIITTLTQKWQWVGDKSIDPKEYYKLNTLENFKFPHWSNRKNNTLTLTFQGQGILAQQFGEFSLPICWRRKLDDQWYRNIQQQLNDKQKEGYEVELDNPHSTEWKDEALRNLKAPNSFLIQNLSKILKSEEICTNPALNTDFFMELEKSPLLQDENNNAFKIILTLKQKEKLLGKGIIAIKIKCNQKMINLAQQKSLIQNNLQSSYQMDVGSSYDVNEQKIEKWINGNTSSANLLKKDLVSGLNQKWNHLNNVIGDNLFVNVAPLKLNTKLNRVSVTPVTFKIQGKGFWLGETTIEVNIIGLISEGFIDKDFSILVPSLKENNFILNKENNEHGKTKTETFDIKLAQNLQEWFIPPLSTLAHANWKINLNISIDETPYDFTFSTQTTKNQNQQDNLALLKTINTLRICFTYFVDANKDIHFQKLQLVGQSLNQDKQEYFILYENKDDFIGPESIGMFCQPNTKIEIQDLGLTFTLTGKEV